VNDENKRKYVVRVGLDSALLAKKTRETRFFHRYDPHPSRAARRGQDTCSDRGKGQEVLSDDHSGSVQKGIEE
jgi:hypothetical protein